MESPYKLAKNVLLSGESGAAPETAGRFASIDLYGAPACENDAADGSSSFHLENGSGTGDISLYRVFPGIELIYNDMHMSYCNRHQQPAANVMEINYCKEGRSECLFGGQRYCYMSAGDLSFCSLQDNAHQSEFPTSHYHGITVTIDFSAITGEMEKVLELLAVDLARIRALSQAVEFTIIRADTTVEHIFSELYKVPASIRLGYIRVKVLELLLVLTGLEPAERTAKRVYFPAAHMTARLPRALQRWSLTALHPLSGAMMPAAMSFSPTPITMSVWKRYAASTSMRATMRIPASSPTSAWRPTPPRRPITLSSATAAILTRLASTTRAATPTGWRPAFPQGTIRL